MTPIYNGIAHFDNASSTAAAPRVLVALKYTARPHVEQVLDVGPLNIRKDSEIESSKARCTSVDDVAEADFCCRSPTAITAIADEKRRLAAFLNQKQCASGSLAVGIGAVT